MDSGLSESPERVYNTQDSAELEFLMFKSRLVHEILRMPLHPTVVQVDGLFDRVESTIREIRQMSDWPRF